MLQQSWVVVVTFIREWPAKCIGWPSVELREFRAQQKSRGRELFMTTCDSCFFAKREKQTAGTSSRFKECMSLQCQRNREHVWKQTSEGKREYPVAMIRRLVNGLFMISVLVCFMCSCLKLTVCCRHLPHFLLHPLHKKPRRTFPQRNLSIRKLIHHLQVSCGHVSKTSLRLLLQRRGCPVWMQHMVDKL